MWKNCLYFWFKGGNTIISPNNKLIKISNISRHYYVPKSVIFVPCLRQVSVISSLLSNSKRCFCSLASQAKEKRKKEPLSNNVKTKSCNKSKVPHDVLVKALNECLSIEQQITTFCQIQQLEDNEVEERVKFTKYLEDALSSFFPNCCFVLTGSSINGYGNKGCDLDISFETGWNESMKGSSYTSEDFPSVEDIESGKVPASILQHFSPTMQLRFIRRVLEKYCLSQCMEPISQARGRCPILKFRYGQYNLSCDLSFNNKSAIYSTHLLQMCNLVDDRIIPLSKVIIYWAKQHGLVGACKFKSYAFVLMVFHFLQTRQPPILPPVEYFLKPKTFDCGGNGVHTEMYVKQFKSENKESLSQLLREFFFFYSQFDYSLAICPLSGGTVNKNVFKNDPDEEQSEKLILTSICIQDPLLPTWNVTTGVNYKLSILFVRTVILMCKKLQDTDIWSSNQYATSYSLTSLFEPVNVGNVASKSQFEMVIPAADPELLLDILRTGLMFDCKMKQRRTLNSDDSTFKHAVCKIECTIVPSWQNRRMWNDSSFGTSEVLEKERTISEDILAKNVKQVKAIQCILECVQNCDKNSLNVCFRASKGTKFPPLFVIFIKEYIPNVFRRINK